MEQVSFPDSGQIFIELKGGKTQKIHLKDFGASGINERIKLDKDVKPDAVIIE